jgi:hypothetical protein
MQSARIHRSSAEQLHGCINSGGDGVIIDARGGIQTAGNETPSSSLSVS